MIGGDFEIITSGKDTYQSDKRMIQETVQKLLKSEPITLE
jgi:hypothetical protein